MEFSEHLIRFFNEFGLYAKDFYNDFSEKSLWYPMLLTIIAVYVLSIVLSKFNFISKNKNKTFVVAKSYVISSMIVAAIIIALSVYAWVIDFKGYFDTSFRFSFILSFIIAFLIAVIKYAQLRTNYTRNKLKNITIQPITEISENLIHLTLKKAFDKFKWWLVLPAFSFLLLFLMHDKYNLVSIVIDASGSMSGGGLDAGKEALINTLKDIDPKTTHFVISVSPHENEKSCPEYTKFSDVLKITNPNRLCSFTAPPFVNESPIDFIQNLNAEGNEYIFYSIWQNYLVSKQLADDNQNTYETTTMLVISDFMDATDEFFNTLICNEAYGFYGFYGDNTYVIDLKGEKPEKFVVDFENCYPNNKYDGYGIDNYLFALEDIFSNMKARTWYFIIWLSVSYVIFLLIIFTMYPKKLHAI